MRDIEDNDIMQDNLLLTVILAIVFLFFYIVIGILVVLLSQAFGLGITFRGPELYFLTFGLEVLIYIFLVVREYLLNTQKQKLLG